MEEEKKKILFSNYKETEREVKISNYLEEISREIKERERRKTYSFSEFINILNEKPEPALRDIYQLFHDMVKYYIPQPKDEYPQTENSIGFLKYDSSNLFEKDCNNSFFADRLFTNRFMKMVNSFRGGIQNNRIYLFEGPPGSGKSLFLNNLLQKFEEYTKSEQGTYLKIHWQLDVKKLGGFRKYERTVNKLLKESGKESIDDLFSYAGLFTETLPDKTLNFSCPNHDHPILLIPKKDRKDFLERSISNYEFKFRLFHTKEYEWIFQSDPCPICSSIFSTVVDMMDNPADVYKMIFAKKSRFDRKKGEGISVFNPGDVRHNQPLSNHYTQNMINDLLKCDDVIYSYSPLSRTNNGIYALMDIKGENVERLKNLHGIISDGVHKVNLIEERIKSIFFALINPEDKKHYENVKSFKDRITTVKIPYILDYHTEVSIYKDKLGEQIEDAFLPGVLENFAKIVIASRLEQASPAIKKWIQKPYLYNKYMDKNYFLLKMEIYTGNIPTWLTEDDKKAFTKSIRKELIAESEHEGGKGFSGRKSLNVFNEFYMKYSNDIKLITMDMIEKFFKKISDSEIPYGFIDSIINFYDYSVLQNVKEAIYYYNEEQISHDIINYLYAINFDKDEVKICPYTKDKIEISEEYFKNFEAIFLGTISTSMQRNSFRKEIHKEYISKTLSQEIQLEEKQIKDTELFKNLFEKYTRNLKQNSLAPYIDNINFNRAIADFGTNNFNSYDERIKRDVTNLITNLKKKFNYHIESAKQVSLYVLEKKIANKY